MSAGFTKGPWTRVGHSWQHTSIYSSDGTRICSLDLEDWGVTEDNQDALEKEQSRVANLIAAAPDLFRALNQLTAFIDKDHPDHDECTTYWAENSTVRGRTTDDVMRELFEAARAALSKAKGE